MTQTITRLFDRYEDAERAVRDLEAAGVPRDSISLVSNRSARPGEERSLSDRSGGEGTTGEHAAHDAGKGATAGGVIGGVGGLLAGLGMLAIPGIGPVVAAGWLASTITGAAAGAVVGGAAGGLIGALTHAGVSEEDAHVYAEGVRRGGTLVAVRADEGEASRIQAVLDGANGIDATARGAEYRESGWSRFDETSDPATM